METIIKKSFNEDWIIVLRFAHFQHGKNHGTMQANMVLGKSSKFYIWISR